jgi:ATP-dependent Clp protease protease subunit
MNKFWKLTNSVDSSGSTLTLDGPISQESWWGDEVTPQAFRDELKEVNSNKLTVIINSAGGDVWAGVAIHDALKAFDGEVTVKVSGLAASIASVIAMAGDKILITPGSTMMIHRASMLAIGNADDLSKAISMLETVEDGIISIYTDRTGQSREAVKEMLDAETWMSAEKAVEMGFADEVVKPKSDDEPVAQNIFSGSFALSMSATKNSLENFVSKVTASNTDEVVPETPEPVVEPEKVETKPKTEEVVVTPVEDNKTTDKENIMTEEEKKAQDLAKSQVIEPKNQAPVNAPAKPSNYLKSKASVEDFANVLLENAGKKVEDVQAAWKGVLVKNGLTDPNYFALPEPLVTNIEDAVKASGIYNALNHTGLDVFKAVFDDADEDADTSRAGGHRKGDTKDQQILDFDGRVIRAKYIYKYLILDKETIRENRSTGALVRFVLNELPTRIIREIERAVVIGDGRATNNKRHITSFLPVKADVVAENSFAAKYVPATGESHYESLTRALDLLETEGSVFLISKKGYVTDLKLETNVNGGYIFAPGADVVSAMGLAGKFEPTWFKDASDPDYDAYLVVLSSYNTVGDNSIEAFTNFKLATNENEFLQEIYKGGGLVGVKAAVGIAKPVEA